jgi:hypothetical protein
VIRQLFLGAALAATGCAGCQPTTSTGGAAATGGSGASGGSSGSDYTALEVGGELARTCNAQPDGIRLPITAVSCTIVANGGRVRANLDTNLGNPLLAVTFDGMEPGQKSTADQGATAVILQDVCPARAKGSPEPCTVELVNLTRGDEPATGGAIEPGSSLTFRVSCPESLIDDAGDAVGITHQSPQRFQIQASPCAAH